MYLTFMRKCIGLFVVYVWICLNIGLGIFRVSFSACVMQGLLILFERMFFNNLMAKILKSQLVLHLLFTSPTLEIGHYYLNTCFQSLQDLLEQGTDHFSLSRYSLFLVRFIGIGHRSLLSKQLLLIPYRTKWSLFKIMYQYGQATVSIDTQGKKN